jgi:CheY-like chemotaxis protein
MDGYEVCRRLRAEGLTTTRVIALTGYGQDKDEQLAMEAGFDEHTVKPVEFERLMKLLAAES